MRPLVATGIVKAVGVWFIYRGIFGLRGEPIGVSGWVLGAVDSGTRHRVERSRRAIRSLRCRRMNDLPRPHVLIQQHLATRPEPPQLRRYSS